MPPTKYSVDDARVARCMRDVLGAGPARIGRWMGIGEKQIGFLLREKKGVPIDDAESGKALLQWWFDQKLSQSLGPRKSQKPKVREELLKQFDKLITQAEELRNEN